jgi:hypothetical protein
VNPVLVNPVLVNPVLASPCFASPVFVSWPQPMNWPFARRVAAGSCSSAPEVLNRNSV